MSGTDDNARDPGGFSQQLLQDLKQIDDTAGSPIDNFRRRLMAMLVEHDRDRGIRGHLAEDHGEQLIITIDDLPRIDAEWRPQPSEHVFVVPMIEVPGPAPA